MTCGAPRNLLIHMAQKCGFDPLVLRSAMRPPVAGFEPATPGFQRTTTYRFRGVTARPSDKLLIIAQLLPREGPGA